MDKISHKNIIALGSIQKLRRKPTLDENWGPSVVIGFRGTIALKEALAKRAERYGLTYSKYLRALVIQAIQSK